MDGRLIAPASAPRRIKRVIAAANEIVEKPYVYGGGHKPYRRGRLDRGYDCSGAVSHALHGGGFLRSPLPSGALMSWGSSGPGPVDHGLRPRRPRLRGRGRLPLRHLDARPRRPGPVDGPALEQDAPQVVRLRGAPPRRLLSARLIAHLIPSALRMGAMTTVCLAHRPRALACRRRSAPPSPTSPRGSTTRTGRCGPAAAGSTGRPTPQGARQRVVVTVTRRTKLIANGVTARVGARRRHRGRQAGRGDRRLVRAGQGRQHLVPRRGHDRVRERQAGLEGRARSRRASTARSPAIDHARPARASACATAQEYYRGHAEDRARIMSLRERAEVPFGFFRRTLMTRDENPLRAAGCSSTSSTPAGSARCWRSSVSGGSDREELVAIPARR